jgi:cell wall-associated NlpC family hydrolase
VKDQGISVSTIRVKTLLRRLTLVGVAAVAASLMPSAAEAATPPPAASAPVATATHVTVRSLPAQAAYAARMRSYRIVGAARAQQGKPYRFGAGGPNAFDCSGLTGYAYRHEGIVLPRTADQQYRAARPVPAAAARPGDLVFWVQGGHAYHTAVYAGAGHVWHAPKPGRRVQLEAIWSWSQVHFGRIGV